MQVNSRAGRIKGIYFLCQQASSHTSQDISCAGSCQRGIGLPVDTCAAIWLCNDRTGTFEHKGNLPLLRLTTAQFQAVDAPTRYLQSMAEAAHLTRVRCNYRSRREQRPPTFQGREIIQAVGIDNQMWTLLIRHSTKFLQ